ncbi:MAG: ATP-binding protein [candidate division WOR-3 bacterium]
MKDINKEYLKTLRFYCELLKGGSYLFDEERTFGYRRTSYFSEMSSFLRKKMIKELERSLGMLKRVAERKKIPIPLEEIKERYKLTKEEWLILSLLYFQRMEEKEVLSGKELLSLISDKDTFLEKLDILSSDSKLLKNGLILEGEKFSMRSYFSLPFEKTFMISDWAFCEISGINIDVDIKDDKEQKEVNKKEFKRKFRSSQILIVREPKISFDHLILPDGVKEKIFNALWQYQNGERVFKEYGLDDKIPYNQPVIMLFYGPSGTGKTATGEAIAKYLNKKLGICNYAQLYDCFVGESEKNLLKVFEEAKEHNCVLLFDEAETLFGERLREHHSVERMHNTMTNLLMQILERTEQLIILTTNREFVMDKAFERRILLKLKFDIPNEEHRQKIWELFLKDCPKLNPDISFAELAKYPLSGGKIKNAVIKTVMKCGQENREITLQDLIKSVKEEMTETLGKEERIGFVS